MEFIAVYQCIISVIVFSHYYLAYNDIKTSNVIFNLSGPMDRASVFETWSPQFNPRPGR
jgi:hypothetical protein